jgi:hypothetical protein
VCATRASRSAGLLHARGGRTKPRPRWQGRRLDEEAATEAASIALAPCTTDAQTAFKPELGRRILAQGLLAAAAMTPPAQRAV